MSQDLGNFVKKLNALERRMKNSKEVLHRIGAVLTNQIKLNIVRKSIIDTGKTLNSVGYSVQGDTLTVRAFGTKYAKFHEFGTKPSIKMARYIGMMAARKSRPRGSEDKGVIEWGGRPGAMTARIIARPFFYPAIEQTEDEIKQILVEWYSLNAD